MSKCNSVTACSCSMCSVASRREVYRACLKATAGRPGSRWFMVALPNCSSVWRTTEPLADCRSRSSKAATSKTLRPAALQVTQPMLSPSPALFLINSSTCDCSPEAAAAASGASRNFENGVGRQYISPVTIYYHKCTQLSICLFYGKRRFTEKFWGQLGGEAPPPHPAFESATGCYCCVAFSSPANCLLSMFHMIVANGAV